MIPRTVLMAQEVAAQLTSTQLQNFGNIILNGYQGTGSVRPALKGWTTNYYEYYTQLQPNGYGVNPGDPTMFEYSVHSFVPSQAAVSGIISTTGSLVAGTSYVPGVYDINLTGGAGTGAFGSVTVGISGGVTGFTLLQSGSGYAVGNVLSGFLPGGSGWSVTVTGVTSTPAVTGGAPRWAQPPRRLINNQVADFSPPGPNQQAIPYSAILYPVADNLVAPPIDHL